jgi:hypothetical protein
MSDKENADMMVSFAKLLETEIKNVDEIMIPLLREYLNNVRDIRMALGREVKDIVLSSQEMTKACAKTEDIIRLVSAIELLKKALTPETLALMKKISND